MKPSEGTQKQIEIYRCLSGRERLEIAFEIWEFAFAQVKASEKALHPELDEAAIDRRARKRMIHGTIGSH
jgi:hypothetical protein